jgi:hypothetical protein
MVKGAPRVGLRGQHCFDHEHDAVDHVLDLLRVKRRRGYRRDTNDMPKRPRPVDGAAGVWDQSLLGRAQIMDRSSSPSTSTRVA